MNPTNPWVSAPKSHWVKNLFRTVASIFANGFGLEGMLSCKPQTWDIQGKANKKSN
jgi:hypothetical protein